MREMAAQSVNNPHAPMSRLIFLMNRKVEPLSRANVNDNRRVGDGNKRFLVTKSRRHIMKDMKRSIEIFKAPTAVENLQRVRWTGVDALFDDKPIETCDFCNDRGIKIRSDDRCLSS